jgi:hypothetical protein
MIGNRFHLVPAADVLAAVAATPAHTGDALIELADRAMRESPRWNSADALMALTGRTERYEPAMRKNAGAYNAWIAVVRTVAAPILDGAGLPSAVKARKPDAPKPAASPKAKAAPKAKAKARASAKPAASGGIDANALAAAIAAALLPAITAATAKPRARKA